MQPRTPSSLVHLELARARQLQAEGRHEEALLAALTLLRQTLDHLHHGLLSLRHNLAQFKAAMDASEAGSAEDRVDLPVNRKTGGPFLH